MLKRALCFHIETSHLAAIRHLYQVPWKLEIDKLIEKHHHTKILKLPSIQKERAYTQETTHSEQNL